MFIRGNTKVILKAFQVLVFCLVMGFLLASCQDEEKEKVPATFAMELKNSQGEAVSMEEFKGRVIFFNVWATWCPPCIEEMPTIHNLYEEVGNREEIAFLMLSMDQDFDKAISFRNENGYNFEIYRLTGPMPAMYSTELIPTTFVIDQEGNLVLQHDGMGQFDSPKFKQFIKSLLD